MPSTASSWLSKTRARAGEVEDARVDAGGLDDAAVLGDVAVEHGEPAVLAEGMGDIADRAAVAVEVERVVAPVLAERDSWLRTPPGAAR